MGVEEEEMCRTGIGEAGGGVYVDTCVVGAAGGGPAGLGMVSFRPAVLTTNGGSTLAGAGVGTGGGACGLLICGTGAGMLIGAGRLCGIGGGILTGGATGLTVIVGCGAEEEVPEPTVAVILPSFNFNTGMGARAGAAPT